MTAIHEFRCDSCKTTAKAQWNGEHWITPVNWTEMFDRDVNSLGHICPVCYSTLWHLNLRTTKIGKDQAKKIGP